MRKLYRLFVLSVFFILASCQTLIVSANKPFDRNSLELYQKYTFQLQDASMVKVKVLRIDNQNVYGRKKDGASLVIKQTDIREVKKLDLLSSVALGVAAVALVVLIPI